MFANNIILTDKDPKKTFYFDYSFSNINIKRIEASSLIGKKPDEWYGELSKLTLIFKYTDKTNRTVSFPLNLAVQTRLDQWNPIIEYNEFIVPEENKNKMTSLGNFVTELNIELKFDNSKTTPVEIKIYFEKTPGVR
jgi:hypothetical protein